MRRYIKYLINIPIIAAIIGGVALYNYMVGVAERRAIHEEIMSRMMQTPHAKELKPLAWDNVAAVEALDGESVVFVGYGFPKNEGYIRDLGSKSMVGMDPCCDKPITYKNVTALSLSPLPYHTYLWKEAPVTVEVSLADNSAIEFMADTPGFYRGTLELRRDSGRSFLALKEAEKVDTSKGSKFGSKPAAPASPLNPHNSSSIADSALATSTSSS